MWINLMYTKNDTYCLLKLLVTTSIIHSLTAELLQISIFDYLLESSVIKTHGSEVGAKKLRYNCMAKIKHA